MTSTDNQQEPNFILFFSPHLPRRHRVPAARPRGVETKISYQLS